MTATATVCGSNAWSEPSDVTALPPPGTISLPVDVTNTDGDWMVAVIAWRVPAGYPAPAFTVADDVHNWWDPLDAGSSMSSANGKVRCSAWIAPAARAASVVHIAPTSYSQAYAAIVYDVAGLTPWIVTSAATAHANASASVAVTLGAPGATAFLITVAASDNLGDDPLTLSEVSWGSVTSVTSTNGTDTTADINCSAAFQVTTLGRTATWNAGSGTPDLAAAIGSIRITVPALAQVSPAWPVTIFEMAPGSGLQTPPDALAWTPVTTAALDLTVTQGRQYEFAALSTGEGTMTLDNPLGAFIPPGTGPVTGIDAGTPVRLRTAWQGGSWQVSFHGDGSTAVPQIDTGNVFPVTAGTQYSIAAWLGSSVPWSSGMTISLHWKNSGGTLISTSVSAPQPGPRAFLATATGHAPATATQASVIIGAKGTPASTVTFYAAAAPYGGLASGYLTIPAGISWAGENGAAVTTISAFSPDVNGPPDICPWHIPFNGFIERLPQGWDPLLRGVTEASVTDAWFGANFNLQPVLPLEILNDLPYAYWPCSDAAGSPVASNLAPGNNNALAVAASKYGTTGTTQAFGNEAPTNLLGAQSTLVINPAYRLTASSGLWQETLTDPAADTFGSSLTVLDDGFPEIGAGGVTIEFFFQNTTPFADNGSVLVNLASNSSTVLAVGLDLPTGSFGTGKLRLYPGPLLASAINIGTVNYMTGTPPMTQVAVTFDRTTYTAYVNGISVSSGSWGVTLNPEFFYLSANGMAGTPQTPVNLLGVTGPYIACFSGWIGHVAVYGHKLPQARIYTHYKAGITALKGENSERRIERLLQAGNATGRRAILQQSGIYATNVASCQDIPGQPASQSVSNIVQDLLPGMFLIAPTGDLFHLSRQYAYDQPVRWVLGEDGFAGEYQYEGDIAFDFDPAKIINQIQITQLDNQDVVVPSVTAIETASQKQYGTLTDYSTGYLAGDATVQLNYGPGLYDLANWLANIYRKPILRLVSVTVDASADPRRMPFVLGAAAGDLTVVNRRPLGPGTPLISVTGRITQTERKWRYGTSGVTASLTCLIDPAPEAAALMTDNTTLGVLSGSNVLAW